MMDAPIVRTAVNRPRKLLRATVWKSGLALLDQAVTSGTSFGTAVLIGRMCGPDELGIYSLGFTLVVLLTTVQGSLISAPYTTYGNRLRGRPRAEYAGSVWVHWAMLSLLASAILAVVAALGSAGVGPAGLPRVLWAIAGSGAFLLLREFARQLAFAHLDVTTALVLDTIVAVVQLGGLGLLAAYGVLSASTAYVAIGLACAAAGGIWLATTPTVFIVRGNRVLSSLIWNWKFGKWVFAERATSALRYCALPWLLALFVGDAAVGTYAACMAVVSLSNPFLQGIGHVMAPRVARAAAEGGRIGVRRVVWKAGLLMGSVMALFCATVALFGSQLITAVYGDVYAGQGYTITVLAIALLTSTLGQSPVFGLLALERSDVTFKARALGLVVTVAVSLALIGPWGVLGAAYALMAGSLAAAAMTCHIYRRIVLAVPGNACPADSSAGAPPGATTGETFRALSMLWRVTPEEESRLHNVLRQFNSAVDEEQWVIEPLNTGGQARLFVVSTHDRRPLYQGQARLVVKLYRAQAVAPEVMDEEWQSLAALSASVHNAVMDGWKIVTPQPVAAFRQPPALVLTEVPGTRLDEYLFAANESVGAEDGSWESLAAAVSGALHRFWNHGGRAYGELHLQNILCDPQIRTISFVDPGKPDTIDRCRDVSRTFFPQSRDLACMLFEEVVTNLTPPLSIRRWTHNGRAFIECVVCRCIKESYPQEHLGGLLDELEDCVMAHCQRIHIARPPVGLWRRYLKRRVQAALRDILGSLRKNTAAPPLGRHNDRGEPHPDLRNGDCRQ